MKHVEGVKIRPLLALTKSQNHKHKRLQNEQDLGPKVNFQERWYIEWPNEVEPFYNVVEGLKISTKPVGVGAPKTNANRLKTACKIVIYKLDIETSVSWRHQMKLSPSTKL